MFIYFWDNTRDRVQAVEGQTEGDKESEAGSRLWAVSPEPNAGLEPTSCEIMTWAEVGRSTDWATQVPRKSNFFLKIAFTPMTCLGINLPKHEQILDTEIKEKVYIERYTMFVDDKAKNWYKFSRNWFIHSIQSPSKFQHAVFVEIGKLIL